MTEKYKIYLAEDTKTRLINDAELFEFTRSDGSVNLNGFLKELIVNYFDRYQETNDELRRGMLSELMSVKSLKSKDASILMDRIIRTYMTGKEPSGKSTVITLTVSGESYDIIRIIENNFLKENSLSGYIKDMFLSYLSIPRSLREEIIFRHTYESIGRAIRDSRLISFSSSNRDFTAVVEPYLIATSKEEQFSYLLCRDPQTGRDRTFRISRLRNVYVTSDTFVRDTEVEAELSQKGLSHPHSVMPDVHAVIRMTERGKQMFKMIVKNRPDVSSTDGDLYHFDWPESQLEEYFRRFGKDAVVIKPYSLKSKLRDYYSSALDAYKSRKVSF
ncbi:MAG: WYL domain-containing protein [Clostridiales bacterium]|nr:WYL domain-containing protein [Clostridiales bacterium]